MLAFRELDLISEGNHDRLMYWVPKTLTLVFPIPSTKGSAVEDAVIICILLLLEAGMLTRVSVLVPNLQGNSQQAEYIGNVLDMVKGVQQWLSHTREAENKEVITPCSGMCQWTQAGAKDLEESWRVPGLQFMLED